jgi:hypothetical protein
MRPPLPKVRRTLVAPGGGSVTCVEKSTTSPDASDGTVGATLHS